MREMKAVKPFDVRDVKFTVDKTPENNTPEKIEQRLRNLIYIALSILAREGKLQSGLTEQRIREIWERHNPAARYRDCASKNVDAIETAEPVIQEIRIRLRQDILCQIEEQARRLRISRTELARTWILEGLSRCI